MKAPFTMIAISDFMMAKSTYQQYSEASEAAHAMIDVLAGLGKAAISVVDGDGTRLWSYEVNP